MTTPPVLVWFRRDFRMADHPALVAAVALGRPVIPVFILDPVAENLGAAPKWRLGLGVEHLAQALERVGSRLILRRGAALACLRDLIEETGATAVYWSRLYEPASVERDTGVKSALKTQGIDARSFGGHLLFEPWTVETKTGAFYKVYSPFWKAVKGRDLPTPLPAPARLPRPDEWPRSESLADWNLGADMQRGAIVLAPHQRVGEDAAWTRLLAFVDEGIAAYRERRNEPGIDGTSGLSENLSLGEISPLQCWYAGIQAMEAGKAGAETYLKELVWREFAYHLMHHTPHILTRNWKPDWDTFPWAADAEHPHVKAWQQGRTGLPFVDAAMREMYVTGRMHNRARMIVASYLTKHLLTHWRIGLSWFEDCLTDWDPASNAMGWQWTAGCGPDATPYFRIFNPDTQLDKFDPNQTYTGRWIAEGKTRPSKEALSYFEAIPRVWNMEPSDAYPAPIVSADAGRKIALAAYENRNSFEIVNT